MRRAFQWFPIVFAALAASAGAQHYPTKPVRFIVPYTPGGSSDIIARIYGQRLAAKRIVAPDAGKIALSPGSLVELMTIRAWVCSSVG